MSRQTKRGRRSTLMVLLLSFVASSFAYAGLPKGAMRFSHKNFAKHSQAVENLTLRASNSAGDTAFVRLSIANAGFQKGKLTITVLLRHKGRKIYGKQSFKRGSYVVFKDRFGVRAGGNVLESVNGKVVLRLALKTLTGVVTLTPRGPSATARDRDKTGFIRRHLVCPWGRLELDVKTKDGLRHTSRQTALGIYESSTLKAHRSYDQMVQLHDLRGSRVLAVDYLIGPRERRGRPLGFIVIRDKTRRFAGVVQNDSRGDLHRDRKTGYQVPWLVTVSAQRAGQQAVVRLRAARLLKRKNELAKMSYLTRKMVEVLFRPFSYRLAAKVAYRVGAEAPMSAERASSYTYNQAR